MYVCTLGTVARKSKKSIANETMKDPDIKNYIMKLVGMAKRCDIWLLSLPIQY